MTSTIASLTTGRASDLPSPEHSEPTASVAPGVGVVIPVCNRRENLSLLLSSLSRQTTGAFHVVVADDGSTDGTRAMVESLAATEQWGGRLSWIGCGPDLGVRTARARNIGVANLHADTSLVVLLDSDLVVQPNAMESFTALHQRHPSTVISGLVDWLPPSPHTEVEQAVATRSLARLRGSVPQGIPRRVGGTFVGPELRTGLFEKGAEEPVPLRPEWALPLNSAWPVDVYWSLGGFDEAMTGYGYEDNEFGARALAAGVQCLPRPELWALHVWHPKPDAAMSENQKNLDYYLRRHGRNQLMETDVDWTLWFHYHAERGGTVVRGSSTLWALDADGARRLALPDLSWLARLGHYVDVHQLPWADPDLLVKALDHGTAQLTES
ncbi:glycosyltransferase [Kitasatospora sp. HPMI-4]|uniref:glycosyltransferase family 2 protein n=1 Tax=Kitasatospora sp. HPMI-4 TaxID=3448443 RepID=UPI003F195789